MQKCFDNVQTDQKLKFQEDWVELRPKIFFAQTILYKIFGTKLRNPVKLDTRRKAWYLLLHVFSLLMSKLNLWKGDWALDYVFTQIWHFSKISFFPNFLSLKSFRNSSGNTCTKFALLVIRVRYTCGSSGFYYNIVKFQNVMTKVVGSLYHLQCLHTFQIVGFKFGIAISGELSFKQALRL